MRSHKLRFRVLTWVAPVAQVHTLQRSVLFLCAATALLLLPAALEDGRAQQAAPAAESQPATQAPSSHATPQPAPTPVPPTRESQSASQPATAIANRPPQAEAISEDALRRQFEGKDLFLRGGYLDNTLTFNEHGVLIGHSPQGSYTLSAIRINKVRLLKHKVEFTGARYGLHFNSEMPYDDPTKALDRVNITPKKKAVRITIDREYVVKLKQQRVKEKGAPTAAKPAAIAPAAISVPASNPAAAPTTAPTSSSSAPGTAPNAASTTTPTSAPDPVPGAEPTDADELKAEIAKAPEAERPADANSVTTTTSPAHANSVLEEALGNVFAQGFDTRMMASMPGFWKLYYEAVAAQADYQPSDPNVLRQNMVDRKARLKATFEPASNQFAQDYGVAGMSEYHVVVGADGKPVEIAVARPIGFGLDESAVDAIRKASFEPAIKDGKPVPVLLNMVFEFRIYSKRTEVESKPSPDQAPEAPSLPGPYSVQH